MAKMNPWLQEKLREVNPNPETLSLILEVEPEAMEDVKRRASEISGVSVGKQAFNYVEVTAPADAIPALEQIPGVRVVHYNVPRYPYQIPSTPLTFTDPLIGEIRISEIEVPGIPVYNAVTIPFTPLNLGANLLGALGVSAGGVHKPGLTIIPTSKAREVIEAPTVAPEIITRVAVLDTGAPFLFHPAWRKNITAVSFVSEPPWDGMAHGVWCTTAAFGSRLPTRFGYVDGVVHARDAGHGKVLTTPGMGSQMSVLQGMDWATRSFGAKIVSMSLGGPCQGGMEDPEVKIVEALKDYVIFVVAAGNSGPDEFTVGSPGAAPSAVTVAAYSTIAKETAEFSSRGPQAGWYQDRRDEFDRDHAAYGEDFLKPDLESPGGSGNKQANGKQEEIYSGVQGWYDGMSDFSPGDMLDSMRGTSMATPIAAGLISYLYDQGVVRTAADVKRFMKEGIATKNVDNGYGLIRLSRFK